MQGDKPEEKEEPLCEAPKGGEVIQFDQEEQEAIESELQENARRDEDFSQILVEAGLDPDSYDSSILDRGSHILACRRGLKRLAYERYTNKEYVLAAKTCVKALSVTGDYQGVFRWDGVAEAWLMLAHMHVCAGRFRIAKNLVKKAKGAAKKDTLLTGDLRTFWNRAIKSIELRFEFVGARPLRVLFSLCQVMKRGQSFPAYNCMSTELGREGG